MVAMIGYLDLSNVFDIEVQEFGGLYPEKFWHGVGYRVFWEAEQCIYLMKHI